MALEPLADRVVIKPKEETEEKVGSIIIPDTAKEKPAEGTVVAVGPGRRNDEGERIPMSVKVGDVVLYGKYSGTEVKVNDEDLIIMRESEILAVIE